MIICGAVATLANEKLLERASDTKHVDGPSINYKDEHFAENCIKIG
jgi:hypothetical protein